MRVIRHLARLERPLARVVLTLGNFDGVHLGHQAIVRTVVDRARAVGGHAVGLTFEPHPVAVLAPERAPAIIQPLRERLRLLRELGLDATVVQRFTRAFAGLEPEAFVREFLLSRLQLVHVVVGYNVTFGRNRAGTGATLAALGARLGFGVDVVGPITLDGVKVSSSGIRRLLTAGEVAAARRLLGRRFALRGRVVAGDRRGRTLGFPTANLRPPPRGLIPPDGVYAVVVEGAGGVRPGVLNIGVRPTFDGLRRTVEVHLLDFDGDLYGRWLRLGFVERLRGEMRFPGPDALRAQIAADVAAARTALAREADAAGG